MWYKKGGNKNNNIKESKLDLFVLNLDHSQLNSSTAVQRGGNCSQAKNTIVFGLENKRRNPCIAYKHKSTHCLTHEHQASVIHYRHKLQDVIETVLTVVQKTKQTQLKEGENGSRWYFSCGLWCSEKLVFSLPGSSVLLKIWWTHLTSRDTSLSYMVTQWLDLCFSYSWPPLSLLHFYPFLSSPGSFLHFVMATL